jgi:hypothetical protein
MKQGTKASAVYTTFLRIKFIEDLMALIRILQEAGHAIVLGLDADETSSPSNEAPNHGSIGLTEVFQARHQAEPDFTTTTLGRFIDRVAAFSIPVNRVTLLQAHEPAKSDHLGIAVDLDLHYLFNNACSPLVQLTPRKLTSGNQESVNKYVAFIKKQFIETRLLREVRTT